MANTTSTVSIVWGGRESIMAGTPIDSSSNFANNGNAVGIVAKDVYRGTANATVITAGEWNEDYGAANAGVRISDECKRALPGIKFVNSDGKRIPAASLPIPAESNAGKSLPLRITAMFTNSAEACRVSLQLKRLGL